MTIYVIEQVAPINGAAARQLARAAGHAPTSQYDDLRDGIEEFITGIEQLYAPGTPDIVDDLGATRVTIGAQPYWHVFDSDGVGDNFGAWMGNSRWFENEVPGLVSTLGIRINASAGAYGKKAHTVP